MFGDNSEYWISPNVEIYVGLVVVAVGIASAAVGLALHNGRLRQRR